MFGGGVDSHSSNLTCSNLDNNCCWWPSQDRQAAPVSSSDTARSVLRAALGAGGPCRGDPCRDRLKYRLIDGIPWTGIPTVLRLRCSAAAPDDLSWPSGRLCCAAANSAKPRASSFVPGVLTYFGSCPGDFLTCKTFMSNTKFRESSCGAWESCKKVPSDHGATERPIQFFFIKISPALLSNLESFLLVFTFLTIFGWCFVQGM